MRTIQSCFRNRCCLNALAAHRGSRSCTASSLTWSPNGNGSYGHSRHAVQQVAADPPIVPPQVRHSDAGDPYRWQLWWQGQPDCWWRLQQDQMQLRWPVRPAWWHPPTARLLAGAEGEAWPTERDGNASVDCCRRLLLCCYIKARHSRQALVSGEEHMYIRWGVIIVSWW